MSASSIAFVPPSFPEYAGIAAALDANESVFDTFDSTKKAQTNSSSNDESNSRWAVVGRGNSALMIATLRKRGFFVAELQPKGNNVNKYSSQEYQWSLCWSSQFRRGMADRLPRFAWQRINHFPRSQELSRKDRLHRLIRAFSRSSNNQWLQNAGPAPSTVSTTTTTTTTDAEHGPVPGFDFIPETYNLPSQAERAAEALRRDPDAVWVQKPVASSRGRGVFLFRASSKLAKWECSGGAKPGKEYVISQYINNPLLVNGSKFDLRIYVAVTSFEPLTAFIYENGLARFANAPFRPATETFNRFVHLTNYSVNKLSENFQLNTNASDDADGGKWSLHALLRHLEKKQIGDPAAIFDTIKDVVIKTLFAVQPFVVQACAEELGELSSAPFELFGFDILLDDTLKPWLLEVNLSPSLRCDTPLDFHIKSNLVADLLNLVGVVPCLPLLRADCGTDCSASSSECYSCSRSSNSDESTTTGWVPLLFSPPARTHS